MNRIEIMIAGERLYIKRASNEATFEQMKNACNQIRKELRKNKKEYVITLYRENKNKWQIRSKLFSDK